jgi:hypothetical protein
VIGPTNLPTNLGLIHTPLLPKYYTLSNFPYFSVQKKLVKIGDPDIDRYIEAYYVLGIDIVPMILDNHQLPQMDLV